MAWVTRAKIFFLYFYINFSVIYFNDLAENSFTVHVQCTYNNKAESSNNTSTVHSTYHYRGQFFFSQNVFNSFSTIENWMRVMALSIYFGKTSIWMGRDNSIQIKITCKSKLCRNPQKLTLCISMHTLIYLNDNFKAHVNSASSACLSSNCEKEKNWITNEIRTVFFNDLKSSSTKKDIEILRH